MIPFNKPFLTGNEIKYITDAHERGQLSGDGFYTKACHSILESYLGCEKALLTHSCTAALEMCALLLDLSPEDEIIMPSFTFVSTANAFALRGARIRFVDINPSDLCTDLDLIESLISPRTKAIVTVHYAGGSTDMDRLKAIADYHNLYLIEDSAQALGSKYNNKYLGTFGDLACFSFHETKNIISGEGGALIINNPKFSSRAEYIREKGTNRSSFFRGEIDKYSWVDVGSSYLPGELISAFLYAQLQQIDIINSHRLDACSLYSNKLTELSASSKLSLPSFRSECHTNGHMFYLLLSSEDVRHDFIKFMKSMNVMCVSHYVPLHSSPYGLSYAGSIQVSLPITDTVSSRLVRLPLWCGLDTSSINYISQCIYQFYG